MARLSALTLFTAFILLATTATANVNDVYHAQAAAHRRIIKRYYSAPPAEARGVRYYRPPPIPVGARGVLGGIFGGDGASESDSASQSGSDSVTNTETNSATQSETPTSTPSPSTTPPPPTRTHTKEPTSTSTDAPKSSTTVVVVENSLPTNQAEIDQHREQQSSLTRIPKSVRVSLIIVVSVIIGLVIIWTAVRKWKFRSSRSFQDRLAPIDWQPDSGKAHGGPPNMADVNTSDTASVRRNLFSDDGASSLAPPAHDFTAVRSPSPLSNQYGRSASPAPFRSASPGPAAALQRYPSDGSGRGGYDATARRGY